MAKRHILGGVSHPREIDLEAEPAAIPRGDRTPDATGRTDPDSIPGDASLEPAATPASYRNSNPQA